MMSRPRADVVQHVSGPKNPEIRRRVDWKRMGALFAPYWRQQIAVLICIVVVPPARACSRVHHGAHHRRRDSAPRICANSESTSGSFSVRRC